MLPAPSCAVTVRSCAAPGADGSARPLTTRRVGGPGCTATVCEPAIEAVAVSVAVTVCAPSVPSVTPDANVWVPASPAVNV